jgi:hypothetical protein
MHYLPAGLAYRHNAWTGRHIRQSAAAPMAATPRNTWRVMVIIYVDNVNLPYRVWVVKSRLQIPARQFTFECRPLINIKGNKISD